MATMGHAEASSSSSTSKTWKYDVFLSFRGEDTRETFTYSLYHALSNRGVQTFLDNEELSKGENIEEALPKAIEKSRIAIVVFSENYASYTWCLEELVKIMECGKTTGQVVCPVFYRVDPSEVRHQKGRFGEAMANHDGRYRKLEMVAEDPKSKWKSKKVQKWSSVLQKAANLSGWHFTDELEIQFIQNIVEDISSRLGLPQLIVADCQIGLGSRLSEVNSLLNTECPDDICMVGICGQGGIGKSTIARAVHNLLADSFEARSFLDGVREKSIGGGLVQLQEKLLLDLAGQKNINLGSVEQGIPLIRRQLCNRRVLLFLDDVDHIDQLKALAGAGDWFGCGSRIIITSRDKHLLVSHGVEKIYEVKGLDHHEALELFSWHAFKGKQLSANYVDIANRFIEHINGLPLALKIIGSSLYDKKVEEWESALNKYKRFPSKELHNKLKISYDYLEANEKDIFLDIACFFKGESLDYVLKILDACCLEPGDGISRLVDKCLITIEHDKLRMHHSIQEMGREIVRQGSPSNLGKRSRLWFHEDVLQVLKHNMGTDEIQGILVNLPQQEVVKWDGNAFKQMRSLRILRVVNAEFSREPSHLPNSLRLLEWQKYPWSSLPSDFDAENVVLLNLPNNRLTTMKQAHMSKFGKLRLMYFESSEFLMEIPDMSRAPNLIELHLDGCKNLVRIDDSIGELNKLVCLSASNCTKLKEFPRQFRLTSLEYLNLGGCSKLEIFPDIMEKMEKLGKIDVSRTAIKELPSSIGNLSGAPNLSELYLDGCKNLVRIHDSVGELTKLVILNASGCTELIEFPRQIRLTSLQYLFLRNCSKLERFPDIMEKMERLLNVSVSGTAIKKLPRSIGNLTGLKTLDVDWCKNLEDLPLNKKFLQNLKALNAQGCLEIRKSIHLFKNFGFENRPVLSSEFIEGSSISSDESALTLLPELHFLYLPDCNLYDEDVSIILGWCPNLRELDLSRNKFTKLPEFIKDMVNLERLDLVDCVQLKYIRGVPVKLRNTSARNCASLTCESSDRLLSQAKHEVPSLIIVVPGTRPEWLDHCCEGDCVSFFVRRTFPAFAVCFAFQGGKAPVYDFVFYVRYFINSKELYTSTKHFNSIVGNNMWLYDVRQDFHGPWDDLDGYLQLGWNLVQIDCQMDIEVPNVTVEWSGVHIYKQDTTMEDIDFPVPYPHDSDNISSTFSDNDGELERDSDSDSDNQYMEEEQHFSDSDTIQAWNSAISECLRIAASVNDTSSSKKFLGPSAETQEEPLVTSIHCKGQMLLKNGKLKDNGNLAPESNAIASRSRNGRKQLGDRITIGEQINNPSDIWLSDDIGLTKSQQKSRNLDESNAEVSNIIESTIDEDNMEAFYASLEAEITSPSHLQDALTNTVSVRTRPSEQTQKAFQTLRDFVSKKFSLLLHPGRSSLMKDTLKYLLNLPSEDGISPRTKSVILQLSRSFDQWSSDYIDASLKLESAAANLSRVEKVREDLEANVNDFRQAKRSDNLLCNRLDRLEEGKKELEKQLNDIKAEIASSTTERDKAAKRKREVSEKGKMLKAEWDDLRNQVPRLKLEHEWAETTQANIETEWSKLGEQFIGSASFEKWI